MSGQTDYKTKYNELKARFMESVDTAWRLGFEEGAKQSQLDNANQQMQMAQDHASNMATAVGGMNKPGMPDPAKENNNGTPGVPNSNGPDKSGAPSIQPGNPASAMESQDENPQSSELDEHISKLESMVSKSELSPDDLKKAISDLKSFHSNLKNEREMKKSAQAIPEIAKALHKPSFKMSTQASKNMSVNAKQAVSLQHKIVEEAMAKWESEEKKAGGDILAQLNIEGLVKKEK